MEIDVSRMTYREINEMLHRYVDEGEERFYLKGVQGQRYLGTGLNKEIKLDIFGVAGSDLAAFACGPRITVHGNAEELVGNTLCRGEVVIHGRAGDVAGFSMQDGHIFIRGDLGYRAGIHMKALGEKLPVIICGGTAGDYLGEYMAGGLVVILGLDASNNSSLIGEYAGAGMHGGKIFVRGEIDPRYVSPDVKIHPAADGDYQMIKPYLQLFASSFNIAEEELASLEFTCLAAHSHRPYGNLYTGI